MFTAAHAVAALKSVPEDATDSFLGVAYAGWDARVDIAPLGEDPFAGISDEDLLHGHAGVIAAMALAQANQMRILDSAIVPDRDLVRPTSNPSGKFNEFEVYTPLTPPERYVVWNENGEEEVVVPSAPFYPGLADRTDASQSAISLALEEASEDPYMIALATGSALLQIGIEAGFDVTPVAEILNKAWGLDAAFSPGAVVGLDGASDYAALFAQDRGTNARRLASWQECSTVRSGQLTMSSTDWGPALHCDFRRVRVAAESLFATSRAIEAKANGVLPTGKIVYHVPATSLLSADPQYLFFSGAQPDRFAKQPPCPAAKEITDKIKRVGLLSALWPHTEPKIAANWADSFSGGHSLAFGPTDFTPRSLTGAAVFSAATARLTRRAASLAAGTGRTVMKALSSKLAGLAEGVVTTKQVGWLARFAAVVEIMRLTTAKETGKRVSIAQQAWVSLSGDFVRDLERSLTAAEFQALRDNLPEKLKKLAPKRSAKIPVWALLLEVGHPETKSTHTVLRGLRKAFARAREVAMAASVKERARWVSPDQPEWVASRLSVLREFWAVQYAALGQVAHLARNLRSDLTWWVQISAAVNYFRAGIMRGISVSVTEGMVADGGSATLLGLKAYHAAATLVSSMREAFPVLLPEFGPNERLEAWAYVLGTVTAPEVMFRKASIPRVATSSAVTTSPAHFARAAELLASEDGLSKWIRATMARVAEDCDALAETYRAAALPAASVVSAPASAEFARVAAEAVAAMAAAIETIRVAPPPSEFLAVVEDNVSDDAWDDFLVATIDHADPRHADAVRYHAEAKACASKEAAMAIARWVNANFQPEDEDTGARIL